MGVRLLGIVVWLATATPPAPPLAQIRWEPAAPRTGDVAVVLIQRTQPGASARGFFAGQPLRFVDGPRGLVALVGIDLETPPGSHEWRIELAEDGRPVARVAGTLVIAPRAFPVERLTLPPAMVDLDQATERLAEAERATLLALYATATPDRLWRGPFHRPLDTAGPATGFGARRIINGQPRSPHSGADYAAARGTPVRASNAGRVALVADYVFPGRLVVIDHGLGVYTAYFHLDAATVAEGQLVDSGQQIGNVGATGRVTGPHLHFGAVLGGARVDPEALLALPAPD